MPPGYRRRKNSPARIHRADPLSYCHGLLEPPRFSPNLEALREFFARELSKRFGDASAGGKARALALTPERRRAIAREGGLARARKKGAA